VLTCDTVFTFSSISVFWSNLSWKVGREETRHPPLRRMRGGGEGGWGWGILGIGNPTGFLELRYNPGET